MKGIHQLFGILCCIYYVSCKPNGAPPESCFYMTPRHIHPHTFRKVFPTRAMGLYNITTSADVFRPDRPIRVTLWGPPFKGFMMVAAEEGAKDWPTGIFYSEDGSGRSLSCLGRADTITHQNNSYKDSVSVLWYGPENMMSENIQFIATVVVNLTIYYTNIKSGFVRLDPTLAQTAGGGENGPVAITIDPWLSGGGNAATQAPVNWWSLNGGAAAGGAGGKGAWGAGGSLGSIAGLGGSGSSSWGTGSSWNPASGSGGSSWSGGNSWQQGGSGPSTVSSWQYQNPGSNQPSGNGVRRNWDSKANSVWTWNSGPTTENPPPPPKTGQSNAGGSGSAWSASSIVDILRQLVGGGGAARP